MAVENDKTVSASSEGTSGEAAKETDTASATQNTEDSRSGGEALYTADQLNALLSKIRKDEKAKHRDKIEETTKALKEQSDQLSALEEKLSKAQEKLESLKTTKAETKADVVKELEQLKLDKQKLEKGLEELATLSAKQIQEVELQGIKERLIMKLGLKFPELVTGNSAEELEASAQKAADREKAFVTEATTVAKKEVEQTLNESMAATLPKPLSVNASLGNGNDVPSTSKSLHEAAALPRDQFLKYRAELLREAKRRAGL